MIDEKILKQNSKVVFQEGKRVAWILATNPSENELKFKDLLDSHHIKYKFQKLFFKSYAGTKHTAESYYVAQFWLPRRKLFIEVPQGSRAKRVKQCDFRTLNALDVFPKAQCIKLTLDELEDSEFIDNFIQLIK